MSDDTTERAREFAAASHAHDRARANHAHDAAPPPARHRRYRIAERARPLVAKALARLRAYFEHPSW